MNVKQRVFQGYRFSAVVSLLAVWLCWNSANSIADLLLQGHFLFVFTPQEFTQLA